ncbi:MAG: hypothetical protein HC774_04105, partial [Sphingomonadales bacterium]|nr:hypothetical protein [Sphingomonadales bacterium]
MLAQNERVEPFELVNEPLFLKAFQRAIDRHRRAHAALLQLVEDVIGLERFDALAERIPDETLIARQPVRMAAFGRVVVVV